MATLDRWFTESPRKPAIASTRDQELPEIMLQATMKIEIVFCLATTTLMSSNSENSDEKVCSPPASKRHKSTTVEQDGGAPSRGTCEPREKFRSKWLSEFPWLKYDSAKNMMYCNTCCRHKKKNIYSEGTTMTLAHID